MKIFKNRTFSWWEVGLIKICLLSLGIILGTYFYNPLVNYLSLWWLLFVVTTIYFIIKVVLDK
ncbi:MAG: hypothetical protein KGZ30_01050 [Anaplasmataceae bacterium]|nr:hypothetical protein [Anaplasmataceae bacterium]